jgi:peptidoglycan/xylan/chitin deacetylase (PgdA/CDA1 family)
MNRHYIFSTAYFVATACYLVAILPWRWWVIALIILPLTATVIHTPMFILSAVLPPRDNRAAHMVMMLLLMIGASVLFALYGGWWVRYVAWAMLAYLFALPHVLLLYPTLVANSQLLGPVITCFDTHERELWLTIDDGPTSDTPALLDLLDARGVKATFFVKGKLADEASLRAITDRGHTIGNHSYSHPSGTFWCLGPRAIEREIERGVPSTLFRAPVGMKNPFVHPMLAKRGMRLIGWTARGFDATVSDVDRVVSRIVPRFEPGAIVVLHQGREWSLRCIDRVIREAQQRGYRFVIPDDGAFRAR